MSANDPRELLEILYQRAVQVDFEPTQVLNEQQHIWLTSVVQTAETQKAVIAVIMTSLTKKNISPEQDIRYHKIELQNGYSGRSFDTAYITPFIRLKFPRLAMAESGWLTRSLEQVAPFTLDFPGKIRSLAVKMAFLNILNDVEVNHADPQDYLLVLLYELDSGFRRAARLIEPTRSIDSGVTIAQIITALHNHFFYRYTGAGASRLPVIAVYTAYQLLISSPRYATMRLLPLKSHTTADTKAHSVGDIEIVRKDGTFFEAVEIKHGKLITSAMIENAFDKIQGLKLSRYYLLTTAEPNTTQPDEIQKRTVDIHAQLGCEIIVNGIMSSLKYYLRLLPDANEFLQQYSANLQADFDLNTDIKLTHIQRWQEIRLTLER